MNFIFIVEWTPGDRKAAYLYCYTERELCIFVQESMLSRLLWLWTLIYRWIIHHTSRTTIHICTVSGGPVVLASAALRSTW